MTALAKTFEDTAYCVEATEKGGCRIAVKITVKPSEAEKAYKKATKAVNKQISIPGFRKGKAPDASVLSKYPAVVEKEWKQILVEEACLAALKRIEIYPINKEAIEETKLVQCSLQEGALIQFSYEHFPVVPTIDFSNLTIAPIEKDPIGEQDIQEVIEEVRQAHADWEDITDRIAEESDFVDISVESLNEDPPKALVTDRRFDIKNTPSWLKRLLIGMKPGETIEGVSEVDEKSEPQAQESFVATKVKITLHGIKKIILPQIDEALAKKAGADSVETLYKNIRTNLEKKGETEEKTKRLKALEEALLEAYSFDVPASFFENELESQVAKRLEALEKTQKYSEEEREKLEKECRETLAPLVKKDLQLYFIYKQIQKQGKISATDQDLSELSMYLNMQQGQNFGQKSEVEKEKMIRYFLSILLQQKTKDYALSQIPV